MSNIVYIATSIDGYISDKNGGLDWLEMVPNPDNLDFGWADFIKRIDALIMGRKTLFAKLPEQMEFECIKSKVLLNALVQTHYRRKK